MPQEVLTKSDYQALMQNPSFHLTDPKIKNYQIEKDLYGIPRVRSGGLALTYKLSSNGRNLALRCFHKVSPRREQHYIAINKFLENNPSPILITTSYQPEGIKYQGGLYPITIMDWIEGDVLGTYVYKNYKNRFAMSELCDKFENLVKELNHLKIAHGDLSHTNIMVANGHMILIDYDGMYVPALKGSGSVELGNRSFQHPGRTSEDFGPTLDCFSEIVIYLALKAITVSPTLYNDYGTGREGLLFTQSDFIEPNSSKLINEIEKIPELTLQICNFKQICQSDFSSIPTLDEFLRNSSMRLKPPNSTTTWNLDDDDFALDARNELELLKNETESVVVIGKITRFRRGSTISGNPYLFLNVGDWPNQTFTVVIWSDTLAQLENDKLTGSVFKGSYVSVSGVISQYDKKPQIVLESPADIAIISYADVIKRLNRRKPSTKTIAEVSSASVDHPSPKPTPTNQQQIDNELNKLYGTSGIYGNQLLSSQPIEMQPDLSLNSNTQNTSSKAQPIQGSGNNLPVSVKPSTLNDPIKDPLRLRMFIDWLKGKPKP